MDELLAQWRKERPDLDLAPLGIYGRLFRIVQLTDIELAKGLAPYGLQQGWFDWRCAVLSTLRSSTRQASYAPPFSPQAG